jgi:hypothetical protein
LLSGIGIRVLARAYRLERASEPKGSRADFCAHLIPNITYSFIKHSVLSREKVKTRTYSTILAVIGLLILALGLWVLEIGLINDRVVKVESLQISDSLTQEETMIYPVYAYPNEGVNTVEAGHDMYIRVDYRNVNGTAGTLRVEDQYSIYGNLSIGQTLDSKIVTGSGSIVFTYSYSYVGLHWIQFTPNYVPGYNPPIEISIYTDHYALSYKEDIILYGVLVSLVGTILASIGLSVVIYGRKNRE